MDEFDMSYIQIRTFFASNFPSMQRMQILEDRTSGTPTNCAWELLLEIVFDVDEPKMGIVKGEKTLIRGVAVLEWRWEGEGDWDGSLVDEGRTQMGGQKREKGIRGWKIVREHDYMVTLKKQAEGGKVRLFSG